MTLLKTLFLNFFYDVLLFMVYGTILCIYEKAHARRPKLQTTLREKIPTLATEPCSLATRAERLCYHNPFLHNSNFEAVAKLYTLHWTWTANNNWAVQKATCETLKHCWLLSEVDCSNENLPLMEVLTKRTCMKSLIITLLVQCILLLIGQFVVW